jgi:hypothetical protein
VSSVIDERTLLANPSSERVRTEFAEESMLVIGHGITIGEEIGVGGMAVVHLGEQQSLRREVAVKTITAPQQRELLLREAYVTAVLEHPNIVPIYDLVFDHDGAPMLVLKRIEGESWLDEARQEHRLEPGDGPDFIEWNVRIAIHVSRALSFAHTRGIVHLDVKPSNVMIGPFGEVYLLDWGLAGSFDPNEHFLPSALGQRGGTPGYMAPEQWQVVVDELSPRTDVYLLAASLYHAMSGATPWRKVGKEREAQTGERALPTGLRPILERAMAMDPSERTKSAEAFREELEGYLRKRGSIQLGDHAEALAQESITARSEGRLASSEYASVEAAATFSAALRQWPGNQPAIRGQLRLARCRIDDALGRDEPAVATRILATLAEPPKDLRESVEKAVALAEEHATEVQTLRRDRDLSVGMNLRIAVMVLCGPLWVGGWVVGAISESIAAALTLIVIGTLTWSLGLYAFGRELLSNRVNLVVTFNIFCALCAVIGLMITGYVHGDSLLSLAPSLLVLHACCLALITFVFDVRMSAIVVFWLLLFPVSLVWPSTGLWLVVIGNSSVVLGTLWVNVRVRQATKPAED